MLRFPKAVTHFTPGSYLSRPLQRTSVGNVFMAGDWVRGLQHGANGLSQASCCLPNNGGGAQMASRPGPARPCCASTLCQQVTKRLRTKSRLPCISITVSVSGSMN